MRRLTRRRTWPSPSSAEAHGSTRVVLGGDKRTVAGLRDDPRLAPYLAIATERFLTVPDPRRAVLEGHAEAVHRGCE